MKFFAFISLFSALLLGITVQKGEHFSPVPPKRAPKFLLAYKQKIKNSFDRPENANILFSFITGDKNGISPYTKKSFKKVNLSFLLSPSGIHLSGVLFFIMFFIKRIKKKWIKKLAHIGVLSSAILSPSDSIKRLSLLRIIFQIKFLSRIKISSEHIFLLTFFIAFLLGDFKTSPLGFIYSFIFLGTFFSLRQFSKATLIMGLFSTQLILALFMGDKVSLLSIPAGLFESFLFTFLFPVLLIFLATFWIAPFNWGEPLIRGFVVLVHYTAKYLNGSFTSSSIFLIAAIWTLMLMKPSRRKCAAVLVLLFLHTNTAMTPVQFPPNLPLIKQKT